MPDSNQSEAAPVKSIARSSLPRDNMTTFSRRVYTSAWLLLAFLAATTPLQAQFGTMWTFEKPPLEYWQKQYGFKPDQSWLDHARLSVLRWPGCTASFVSDKGLILTNHHCARSCAAAVAPADSDYMTTGFVASTSAEEKKCPSLFLDQLVGIEDITDRIKDGQIIREQCEKDGSVCQIVSFYRGGRYSLYRYRRFKDIRFVFMPEEQVAFYGGDADNFTYPHYALDIAVLRAYENDQPYKPEHFLHWSADGAGDGETVFAVGTPGATNRLTSAGQLEYFRDVIYPGSVIQSARRISVFKTLSARGEAEQRKYNNQLFGAMNGFKSGTRYLAGLQNERYMANSRAFDKQVQARVASRPELQEKYGNAWPLIAAAADSARAIEVHQRYYSFTATDHAWTASQIVRIAVQSQLPDSLRLSPYRQSAVPGLVKLMDEPVDTAYERVNTIAWFAEMQRELPANDPLLRSILRGRTPEQAATRMLAQSHLDEPAFRKSLLDGGIDAVRRSTDPFVIVARDANESFTPLAEAMSRYADVINTNAARVAQAIYAVYGDSLPPDATGTLRISDGIVAGYPYNGTIAPFKTSFYGLYARNAEFDNKGDFALPQRWLDARPRVDLSTPLNFVATTDIIGGNSGSPIINTKGEIVGLVFDNNIEGASNRSHFYPDVMRTVAVHARAIPEALRKVFKAPRIADELEALGTKELRR